MKVYFIWALFIFTIGCNAQVNTDTTKLKKNDMKRFDKVQFMNNKENGECCFRLSDGSEVRQMEYVMRSEYIEEIKNPTTPFSKVNVYYMDSGQIKVSGERFYLFPVGIWKYYDTNENLEKEIDQDASYKYTIYDLAKKMLTMDIDIMRSQKGIDVLRSNIYSPLYIVVYPVDSINSPYEFYNLAIDGITGKIMDKTIESVKN